MIRLVYQRGEFTPEQTTLVATALFWFAFSLPTNGLYLLQTRTFFSLQRPWMATWLAGFNLVISALAAFALYKPFGAGGIVAGTGIGTTAARRRAGGRPAPRARRARAGPLLAAGLRIALAAAALAAVSFGVWDALDSALGRGLLGQIVSLGSALALGGLVYLGAAKLLGVAELEQVMRLSGAGLSHAGPAALPAGRRRGPPARRLRSARWIDLAPDAAPALLGSAGVARHGRDRTGVADLDR